MVWLEVHDEILCREVILVQPHSYRPSTREKGNAWSRIAQSLNEINEPRFSVSRSVRERFNLILTRFKEKTAAELKASGVDVDPLKPSESLLEDIQVQIAEKESEFEAKTQEKNELAEKENNAINDARQKAMETLAETKKRKEAEGESTCRRAKRPRSSGSDTIAYLREKSAAEKELKQMQLDTQREEARNTRLLLEQQQAQQLQQQQMQQQMLQMFGTQQQTMLALLTKMTDTNKKE